jgi:Membrane MotB of proton-channel complex MotA/MotB
MTWEQMHMPRRRRHDDHDNHEAWAIPYGDLVTLLLAFFVVMYAMSSVNEGKYRVLSDSLTEAFHGTPRSPQPIEAGGTRLQPIEQLPLTQVHRMISSSLPVRHIVPAPEAPLASRRSQIAAAPVDLPAHDTAASFVEPGIATPGSDLDQVAQDVSAALSSLIAAGHVRVRRTDSWVAVGSGGGGAAASGRYAEDFSQCGTGRGPHRRPPHQYHRLSIQLGAVGGACRERRASVHGSRHCCPAAGGGRLWRVPADHAQFHRDRAQCQPARGGTDLQS